MGKILTDSQGKAILASGNAFEVTAAVDSNIVPGNIKKDVEILGVTGTYQGNVDPNPVADDNDVVFIDYDGTIRYSYTRAQFLALESMPANPTHQGLTAQGWNWTLADAKEHLSTYPWLIIGQNYITDDGKTRLHYDAFSESVLSFVLYFNQDTANAVTIDWGDGSATETVSGTGEVSAAHTYLHVGKYIITFAVAEGATMLLGRDYGGSSPQNMFGSVNDKLPQLLANAVTEINTGERMQFNHNCMNLINADVSMATTCRINHAFAGARTGCLVVASGDAGTGNALQSLTLCKWLSLPKSYTGRNNQTITDTIVSRISQPRGGYFAYLPGIHVKKLYYDVDITSLGNYLLSSAYQLEELWMFPTTPPTIQGGTIGDNHADGWKIYVPEDSVAAYKAASNWLTYADRIFAMP